MEEAIRECDRLCKQFAQDFEKQFNDTLTLYRVPQAPTTAPAGAPMEDRDAKGTRATSAKKKRTIASSEGSHEESPNDDERTAIKRSCVAGANYVFQSWFMRHADYPLPTTQELVVLARHGFTTPAVANHWFVTMQQRVWEPVKKESAKSGRPVKDYLGEMSKRLDAAIAEYQPPQ
jgi:hypothetical protein